MIPRERYKDLLLLEAYTKVTGRKLMTAKPDPVERTLRKLIPRTCLPSQYEDFQELADAFVTQIAGDYALVPREQYDRMVKKIGRYDMLRKNLPETK